MINSRLSDTEKQSLKEFCDFVEAAPMEPSSQTDALIRQKVEAVMYPRQWLVYGKFFSLEVFAGMVTLFICPQFGLGFAEHNEFLHRLHVVLNPFFFYMACGLFFVVFGAAISALLLSYDEIQSIRKSKYIYFLIYALSLYFIFFMLATEIMWMSLLPWILGVILGNSFSFSLVSRLRFRLITTG